MPELSDGALALVFGGLLLAGLLLGYPALMTALALIREQRVLGKLYWHLRSALDIRLKR